MPVTMYGFFGLMYSYEYAAGTSVFKWLLDIILLCTKSLLYFIAFGGLNGSTYIQCRILHWIVDYSWIQCIGSL